MRSDLTDITLVVDRSGSMEEVRTDAEACVNLFIAEQAKKSGEALLTLMQFDNECELVHNGVPVSQVPAYKLVPGGMTALLDATGRAINETGERLSNLNEQDRPGLVIFVVMTAGLDNASKDFSKGRIQKMIQHQTDVYSWRFEFLGANQDAFAEAGGMGIRTAAVADPAMSEVTAPFAVAVSAGLRALADSVVGWHDDSGPHHRSYRRHVRHHRR